MLVDLLFSIISHSPYLF